ncbi:DUF3179 domain-containing protein [Bacillaceae bacterium IKA-2]|nr:DUF3179 domain-containing protein [Bacillaceae bacterium IKA-2]
MMRKWILGSVAIVFIGYIFYTNFFDKHEQDEQTSAPETFEETENLLSEQQFLTSSELLESLQQLPIEEQEKLLLGGPPPEGIPSIDQPSFISIEAADAWIEENEPVIHVEVAGEARAYPMQIMMWHEIVNDTINGIPVTVTFCPLCNSAFSFERETENDLLDFGTTGYLYNGALLMYDRQTQSLWSHFGGNGISGIYDKHQLEIVPSTIISWSEFKKGFPTAKVLSRDTGFQRDYGNNPYVGYDDVNSPPFLFSGKLDESFAPKERIVAVKIADQAKAYLLDDLQEKSLIEDTQIVLFYSEGTASGLDQSTVAGGKEVGSTIAYFREVDGEQLNFYYQDGTFKDEQTESTWNFFGVATDGPLEGERLNAVPFKVDTFWFAWAAFEPDTEIYDPQ